MSGYPAMKDLEFYTVTGTRLLEKQSMAANTTYYAVLPQGSPSGPWESLWHKYDASIVITSASVESCNVGEPTTPGSIGTDFWGGASFYEAGNANWAAAPGITPLVVAGGAAKAELQDVKDTAAKRQRLVVVVGATGGNYRVRTHYKG